MHNDDFRQPAAISVCEFLMHYFCSDEGFEPWSALPLGVAMEDPAFLERLVLAHVLPAPLVAVLIDSDGARKSLASVCRSPSILRMARLGSTEAPSEERRDLVGPAYVVLTGCDVRRGMPIWELALYVEGYDSFIVLAPSAEEAIERMRPEVERSDGYFRIATNLPNIARLALHMRLTTLGVLEAYGESDEA